MMVVILTRTSLALKE